MPPFPQDITWSLDPIGDFVSTQAGPLEGRIYKTGGHIELAGPDLAGSAKANLIRFSPPAIRVTNASLLFGGVTSSQAISNGIEVKQKAGEGSITARLTFPHEGVMRYEVIDFGGLEPVATAIASRSDGQEHFYGFGEKFNVFDQSGKKVHMLTFDEPAPKNDHSYKVAPWFISTRGYGVHLDSSAESDFDMRAGAADRYVITNFFSTLRFNIVYGPKLTDVLSRFTGYTGRAPVPPPWVFGPWISSDVWRSGGEVRYSVTQFRNRGLPASAFVFDSPWEIAYNDFQFNMTQFGKDATIDGQHFDGFNSPEDMLKFLQQNGLKVICWMAPFVNTSSIDEGIQGQNHGKAGNYDDGLAHNAFVRSAVGGPLVVAWWKGKGSPVDFTSGAGRDWLTKQLRDLVVRSEVQTASGAPESAIGGFKTDDGESGNGPNTYIPTTAHYADGRTGVEMRNAYALEYQRAIAGVLATNGVLFARGGFIGSQMFPAHWAGDNEPNFGDNGLPGVICAGQSAAISGYAIWGHDTGGYQDTNFSVSPPNLFMRWTQFGCFSPIMQMHRQVTKELQYPWRYGEEALNNFRFYTLLHQRLFPYIYTYAHQANQTGLPIIRPLVLMHQSDPNTFSIQHTYQFGNEFLVAPMATPNTNSRQLHLPAGTWLDFWTNQAQLGGQEITWTDTDQSHFPLFVAQGAVIPMLLGDPVTLCDANYTNNPAIKTPSDGLLFLIYPGGQSGFTMFDGTELKCAADAAGVTLTLNSSARPIELHILAAEPAAITRDGIATPKVTAAQFSAVNDGWFQDPQLGKLRIKFQHAGGSTTIRF
jgi:alpha-D-xyloside xylohydrolase